MLKSFSVARILILFVVLILAVTVIELGLINPGELEKMRGMFESLGIWAPFVYVGLYMLLNILLLPATPLMLAAGILFGSLWGGIYTWMGAMLGSTCAFFIARFLIHDFIVKRLLSRFSSIQTHEEYFVRHGFVMTIFLRMTPVVPFNLASVILGATRMPFRDYFFGTAVGIIPGSFLYPELVHSISSADTVRTLLIGLLLIGFILIGYFLRQVYERTLERKSAQ
ncbi:MAG: VTT domain-containing protein [Patescibacteria group bacterium]